MGGLIYLVDTNVWLEGLLQQERVKEVQSFLEQVAASELAITEFSIYSIGIVTIALEKTEIFEKFLSDIVSNPAITKILLDSEDLKKLISVHKKQKLDFDDSYQYLAAEKHNLTIVSFDTHFDRTDLKRKTPAEILK